MIMRDLTRDPNAKSNEDLNNFNNDGTVKKGKKLGSRIENAVKSVNEVESMELQSEAEETPDQPSENVAYDAG